MRNLIQASEAHLADCRFRHLAKTTINLYEYIETDYLKYLRASEAPLALHSLNAGRVRDWAAWHLDQGGGMGKRSGTAMVHLGVGILKTWSRWLVGEDVLEADYVGKLRRPKTTTTPRQPYAAWEIQALRGSMAETVTGVRDVAALALLLDTGIRVGELIGIRLDHLDLTARRLHITTGKGDTERILPFGSTDRDGGKTTRRLRDYIRVRRVSPQCPPGERDKLWLTYDGFPMTKGAFQSMFRKACRRAGLSHTEIHSTRHAFAVNYLVAHPHDVEGLRYLLGHLSMATYRVYVGMAGQLLAELGGRESIAEALEGQVIEDYPGRGSPGRLHVVTQRGGGGAGDHSRTPDASAVPPSRRRRTSPD